MDLRRMKHQQKLRMEKKKQMNKKLYGMMKRLMPC